MESTQNIAVEEMKILKAYESFCIGLNGISELSVKVVIGSSKGYFSLLRVLGLNEKFIRKILKTDLIAELVPDITYSFDEEQRKRQIGDDYFLSRRIKNIKMMPVTSGIAIMPKYLIKSLSKSIPKVINNIEILKVKLKEKDLLMILANLSRSYQLLLEGCLLPCIKPERKFYSAPSISRLSLDSCLDHKQNKLKSNGQEMRSLFNFIMTTPLSTSLQNINLDYIFPKPDALSLQKTFKLDHITFTGYCPKTFKKF
ncbi:unnamed protein product [Moneuplotes crassus]|uniref:Uncharacterized protein n=1 Tax=Euplotes crassus TaxID=5936 RepID=A0AAD1XUH7_EUPCR|nr:unnamed protein product [Moneuplotes crassus]